MEQAAARFFEVERATCFVSGYLGNAVLVQGLRGEYEHTFADKDSHFSIWDATRTVDVPVTPFRHRDPENLATRCRENLKPGERPLVISDGVFSISGEIAPAPDYVQVLESYDGATLCLDDAHATSVIGDKGQGTLAYYGLRAIAAGLAPT